MTIQYPGKLDKSRPVYIAMDKTNNNTRALLNTFVNTLKAGGVTNIKRQAVGPNELYSNITEMLTKGETNAIVINITNGVDPNNLRELGLWADYLPASCANLPKEDKGGNDNNGRNMRKKGNDAIYATFWDGCDFTRSDGTCYNRIKTRNSQTDEELGGYWPTTSGYKPIDYCRDNKIYAVNQSSNNHRNSERADYTGEGIAKAVLALFEEGTGSDIGSSEPIPTETNSTKTLSSRTITKTYNTAYFEKVYQVKTDSNGAFRFKPQLPYRGLYKASMKYGGDKVHNGTTSNINIYNYDSSAKLFVEQLLETITVSKYSDGTVDTVTTGSAGNTQHLRKEITTETYEGGKLSQTTTKNINMDSILEEAENTSVDIVLPSGEITSEIIPGTDGSPFNTDIVLLGDGSPNITRMSHNGKAFVNVDKTRSYTLTKEQYRAVMQRDSQTMQVNNYLVSKYTAFESTDTNTYNVLRREEWNIIEESILYWLVQHDGRYNTDLGYPRVFPEKIVVNFASHRTYIYKSSSSNSSDEVKWKGNDDPHNVNMSECLLHWVGDDQYWGYTCGPTSASVCTQVYHNYYGEYQLKNDGRINSTVGPEPIRDALNKHEFKAVAKSTNKNNALAELDAGRPTVWHFSGHYIALTTRNKNNGKVQICNSATSSKYTQNGASSTGWHNTSDVKGAYGSTVLVDLGWNLTEESKSQLLHFLNSMGGSWTRPDTDEWVRRPNE